MLMRPRMFRVLYDSVHPSLDRISQGGNHESAESWRGPEFSRKGQGANSDVPGIRGGQNSSSSAPFPAGSARQETSTSWMARRSVMSIGLWAGSKELPHRMCIGVHGIRDLSAQHSRRSTSSMFSWRLTTQKSTGGARTSNCSSISKSDEKRDKLLFPRE